MQITWPLLDLRFVHAFHIGSDPGGVAAHRPGAVRAAEGQLRNRRGRPSEGMGWPVPPGKRIFLSFFRASVPSGPAFWGL